VSAVKKAREPGRGELQFKLLRLALLTPGITLGDVKVLALLADAHNWKDGYSRWRTATIAERIGVNEKTVDRAIAGLKAAGLLTVSSGRGRAASRYMVAFERVRSGVADDATSKLGTGVVGTSVSLHQKVAGTSVSPRPPVAGTSVSCSGDTDAATKPPDNRLLETGWKAGEAPAAAPDALAGAGRPAAPMQDVEVTEAWQRLQDKRPGLDFHELAESARLHYVEPGLPAKALSRALEQLSCTRQWRGLPTPEKRARGPEKPSARSGTSRTKRRREPEFFDHVDYRT
jgi:hypothetical protein